MLLNLRTAATCTPDEQWQRNRVILVSDPRYAAQIGEECPGLETHIRPPVQKLPEAVAHVLASQGTTHIITLQIDAHRAIAAHQAH